METQEQIETFTVTYTIKGKSITSRGHTRYGVGQLQNAVLRAGGVGNVHEKSCSCDVCSRKVSTIELDNSKPIE